MTCVGLCIRDHAPNAGGRKPRICRDVTRRHRSNVNHRSQGPPMKNHRALALALAAASAGGASAQSSVTLFGVVDANVRYVKNSGLASNYGMSNSGLSSGRLGFRGIEDLGGGLKAGFWLESDVNADTGT